METQNTKTAADFTGQNIYVGIDTHYKTRMVSIYSDEFELKTFGQEPGVDRLENYLLKHYPNANLMLAYESGFCGCKHEGNLFLFALISDYVRENYY